MREQSLPCVLRLCGKTVFLVRGFPIPSPLELSLWKMLFFLCPGRTHTHVRCEGEKKHFPALLHGRQWQTPWPWGRRSRSIPVSRDFVRHVPPLPAVCGNLHSLFPSL